MGWVSKIRLSPGLFGTQLALALVALTVLAFAPPARGPILLVPLTGHAAARLPATAIAHHALLLGVGPVDGSLVVIGDLGTLAPSLLGIGAIALAAPRSWCGAISSDGDGQ